MSFEQLDDASVNQQLLKIMDSAISAVEQAYEGKAKSFAVILNELQMLQDQFKEKLTFEESTAGGGRSKAKIEKAVIRETKQVFVRLFHRDMPSLTIARASKAWIKPLLESVLNGEKHGLAIYQREQDVKASLTGENDGYATLVIAPEQDITTQRSPKYDQKLGCPLLTIEGIRLEHIGCFTYKGKAYPINGGVMQFPKENFEDEEE